MGLFDIFKKKDQPQKVVEQSIEPIDTNMYFDRYKASYQIFQKIPTLDLGNVMLRGFYPSALDTEKSMYLKISNNEEVKKYLPDAYVNSIENASSKVEEYITRIILKRGLVFCIAEKKSKIPLGYIICHSPLVTYKGSNEELGDWTIDFWLGKEFEGKGIMTASLYSVLAYLQEMKIPRVYAFVDKSNFKSIKLLEKCKLIFVSETFDKKMLKYGVKLDRTSTL